MGKLQFSGVAISGLPSVFIGLHFSVQTFFIKKQTVIFITIVKRTIIGLIVHADTFWQIQTSTFLSLTTI